MRMRGRFISREAIVTLSKIMKSSKNTPMINICRVILSAPIFKKKTFHVLFAVDVENKNVRVVTAYYH
jgi:hypothetical protein